MLTRPARRVGFDLEVRSFYSPIPDVEALSEEFWRQRSSLPGVDFNLERQIGYVERELGSYASEFTPARSPNGERFTFHSDNGLFQGQDATLLFAMVRSAKPRTIIEVGAGFSTLVSAAAVRANRHEGHQTRLVSCDPYARGDGVQFVEGLDELLPVPAEELSDRFELLEAGDILFIDSSHTVRLGGDVVHLLCEVVPRLAPGVLVHLHDIYLPYQYPRDWFTHNRWYWAEQYLLQALLIGNGGLEVLVAAHALWRKMSERFLAAVPSLGSSAAPLSFWMRRRGS
jgi:predicted O-methyltransferase YrrM